MKNKIIKIGITMFGAGTPLITFAQTKDLAWLMTKVTLYFSAFIKLIISLAVLTFVWNVYRYYFKADADRKEAGKYVLYSILGFFIILSFWGLVNIVDKTFNLDKQQPGWPFGGSTGLTAPAGPNSTGWTQPPAPGSTGYTQPGPAFNTNGTNDPGGELNI